MVTKTNVATACIIVLLMLHIVDYHDIFGGPDTTAGSVTNPPRVDVLADDPYIAETPTAMSMASDAVVAQPVSESETIILHHAPYLSSSGWTDQSSPNNPHHPLFSSEVALLQGDASYYAPSPDRYCARWLPTGYTVFCTSFDNDTTMDLESPQPLNPEDSFVEWVPVAACPHNPVKLLVFPQETPIGHAVKQRRLNRRAIKAAFTQRTPVAAAQALQSARAKLYVTGVLLWRQITTVRRPWRDVAVDVNHTDDVRRRDPLNGSGHTSTDGSASASAASSGMGDTDFLSGFQSAILPECLHHCLAYPCCVSFQAEAFNLTHATCNLYAARQDETAYVSPKQTIPLYVLAQRREFRPSLVDDAVRLVITKGPGPIETLDPLCNGCLHKPLEVRLHGEFGVLQHVGYFGTVKLRVLVPDRNNTPVGRVLRLPLQDGIATGDATQFFALISAAGSRVCIEAAMDGPLRDAGEAMIVGIGKPRPALVCTVIGMPPANTVLRFGGPESGFDNASYVSRDPDACAPYLRRTECCIRGFWYRVEDAEGRKTVPDAQHRLFQHVRSVVPRLYLGPPQHSGPFRCFRIVDGPYSIASVEGDGSFPNLVVDVSSCTPKELMSLDDQTITLYSQQHKRYSSAKLPAYVIEQCVESVRAEASSQQAVKKAASNGGKNWVGFSLRAHQELSYLKFQLKAFAAFVQNSVVAVHLSAQWYLTDRDYRSIGRLNESHPTVIVNPRRMRASSWKATHIHASNFQLILDSGFPVSHIVIWAANEIMVRAGIAAYVRKYDMSSVDRLDPRDGIAYYNIDAPVEWWTPEDHRLDYHRMWPWLPWDGVSGELIFAGMLRQLGRKRFPSHQLYLEGTFFSRAVAMDFINVTRHVPLADYCTTSGQYSDNEVFPFLTMQHQCGVTPGLKCGGRVSTVLWREILLMASHFNVPQTRCSPFANPFGWKRVRRSTTSIISKTLWPIMQNSTRAAMVRDDAEHCDITIESLDLERLKVARRLLG